MIEALAPLFAGPFASYRDTLVLRDDPRPSIPLSELLSPDGLPALLARFAQLQDDNLPPFIQRSSEHTSELQSRTSI